MMAITANGHGESLSARLEASLDIEYSRPSVGFTWNGSDERNQVLGDGSADLLDDGSIEIVFVYRNGAEPYSKPNATLLQQPARAR
jgi:hypothetical protein